MEITINTGEKGVCKYLFNYFENIMENKFYPDKKDLIGLNCVVGILTESFDDIESGSFIKCCIDSYTDNYVYVYWTNKYDSELEGNTEKIYLSLNYYEMRRKKIESKTSFESIVLSLDIENF